MISFSRPLSFNPYPAAARPVTTSVRPPPAQERDTHARHLLALAVLVVAVCLAYANSLNGAYLFDDLPSIPDNPTIRNLSHLRSVLSPPHGEGITVEGRPILNLSFAVNYALVGTAVQSYHILNLTIHLLACLLLFELVRRVLEERRFSHAMGVATVASLFWGLHPLQTESVSYLVQRAESLMGCLFLAALFAAYQSARQPRSSVTWAFLCVIFTFLAVGTKEVAVTLPIVILLFDRTFLAGSFRAAWEKRHGLYLGVFASWVLLAYLVISSGSRGGTIGSAAGITPWQYALCQSEGIFHYLWLSVWGYPLVMDYGTNFVSFTEALPWILLLLILLVATGWALVRRPTIGFLGAWFFLILAPTSSFVGGSRQMLAEHRMYLPLAAIAVAASVLLFRYLGRAALWVGALAALALGLTTYSRNEVYRSSLLIYQDTVRHRPQNAWARYNLGKTLDESGHPQAAVLQYEAAVKLNPQYYQARFNWGNSLEDQGRHAEAIAQFKAAIAIRPNYPKAEYNLGNALIASGDLTGSIPHFQQAVRLKPDYLEAQDNLGTVYLQLGHVPEATAAYKAALEINPESVEAHFNLGGAYLTARQFGLSAEEYRFVLTRDPDQPDAHYRLGNDLEMQGHTTEAIEQYRIALQLRPGDAGIQADLDRAMRSPP